MKNHLIGQEKSGAGGNKSKIKNFPGPGRLSTFDRTEKITNRVPMQTGDVPEAPQNDVAPVALPVQGSYWMVPPKSIVYCRAAGNYTHIFLSNGKELVLCKRLKEVEALLPWNLFHRTHQTYLVNLRHVERWVRENGDFLHLSNGVRAPVARLRKKGLKDRLNMP